MGRKGVISQDELNCLVLKLNSHITPGQGSALQRTYQLELVKRKIDHAKLIAKRSEVQQKVADRLGRRSKDDFHLGDKVLAQNMKTRKWTIRGEVVESRQAEDGSTRSFVIKTESGRCTLRNARHLKFQALKKNVTFADVASESDEQAGLDTDCDGAATADSLETDSGEQRVSARLAALAARL